MIAEIKDRQRELASWWQYLHQHPEIAYEEAMTSDFVAAKLERFGIEVHRGLGKTGLVGVIHGQGGEDAAAPSIGLLPIGASRWVRMVEAKLPLHAG